MWMCQLPIICLKNGISLALGNPCLNVGLQFFQQVSAHPLTPSLLPTAFQTQVPLVNSSGKPKNCMLTLRTKENQGPYERVQQPLISAPNRHRAIG